MLARTHGGAIGTAVLLVDAAAQFPGVHCCCTTENPYPNVLCVCKQVWCVACPVQQLPSRHWHGQRHRQWCLSHVRLVVAFWGLPCIQRPGPAFLACRAAGRCCRRLGQGRRVCMSECWCGVGHVVTQQVAAVVVAEGPLCLVGAGGGLDSGLVGCTCLRRWSLLNATRAALCGSSPRHSRAIV